jgi:transposase
VRSLRRSPAKHIDLLPQDQVFRFQRCSCLEARSQDTEYQPEQIGHQDASLCRPLAASTPESNFRYTQVSKQQLQRIPSARTIAHLMTTKRNCMTKADAVIVAAIEAGVPSLVEARALVDEFHDMIRKKDEAELDVWIANAKTSLVSSLATGVLKDRAAVGAAITQPWSNGQVEAQITKLKLVKRQMYGRAKLDLLEARLLGTA